MSTTSPTSRYDSTDETARAPRHDAPLVLAPEDFVVVDSRVAVEHDPTVQRVTSARGSHTEDVGRRMRNYAFSMGIRTLCVIGAVLAFPNWWAWLFVPGAVVLPYVAVILANAGRERTPSGVAAVSPQAGNLPVLRTEDR